MKNVLAVLIGILVLLGIVSLSEAKDKKKDASAEPAKKELPEGGWKDVKATPPHLVKASYRMDGGSIIIHFSNLSKEKTIRIKYHATWKKNENGKWVEDSSVEGMTIRLRKHEDLKKEIHTRSKDVKDVSVTAEADEVS